MERSDQPQLCNIHLTAAESGGLSASPESKAHPCLLLLALKHPVLECSGSASLVMPPVPLGDLSLVDDDILWLGAC